MIGKSILSLAAAGILSGVSASVPSRQPNVIFVFPDQWRASSTGYTGQEPVQTPHLNKFASQSVNLVQAASTYPVSSPYRAMLMSGKYPFQNQVYGNCQSLTAPNDCELPANAVCWSDILAQNGYSLGYIGKWHLDAPRKPYIDCSYNKGKVAWNEWCPPERRHGFSYWYAYGTYDDHLNPIYWATDSKRDEFRYVHEYGPKHEIDRAIDFLRNTHGERNPDSPFGLVVSINPPHTGYNLVPEKYRQLYKNLDVEKIAAQYPQIGGKETEGNRLFRRNLRDYYAQCTAVDEQFGRLLAELEKSGLAENTLVIFTSDHGDMLGSHNLIGKNVAFEESMRVPFLVRFPAGLQARSDSLLIGTPDIPATMLGLLGFGSKIPDDWSGRDFSEQLKNPEASGRPEGQLYLFLTDGWDHSRDFSLGRRGWRNERYTFVIEREKNKPEALTLYDRLRDPAQMHNAASQHPELCKIFRVKINAALETVNPEWKP